MTAAHSPLLSSDATLDRDRSPDFGAPRYVPWGPRRVAAVLGLVVVSAIVTSGALVGIIEALDIETDSRGAILAGFLITLVFDAIIVVEAYMLGPRPFGGGIGAFGLRRFRWWRDLRWSLAGLVAAWVVLSVYLGVLTAADLDDLLPDSTIPDDTFDNAATVAAGALVAMLAAPLAEEVFFRGFVFAGLLSRWGFWPAALVSGTLFSGAHFDLGSLLPFAVVGVILAYIYYRTNSLWTPIAMHFTFNTISYSVAVAAS